MRRLYVTFMLLVAIATLAASNGALVFAQQVDCPGTPPTQFVVGQRGTVLPSTGGTVVPVRVRQQASKTGSVLAQLHEGDTFTVINGPQCADGYLWWQIRTDNGVSGWAAEGDSSGYFLDPIGTNSNSPRSGPVAVAVTATIPPNGPPPVSGSGSPARFADFKVGQVDTAATVAPYSVAPDASNVTLTSAISPEQIDYLKRNDFVVSPNSELEFYTIYEKARYSYEPLFITTDSMLHSFHLIFDKTLRTAEASYFIPLLQQMNKALLTQVQAEYNALKGTDWEAAAKRTVAYISVAAKLANPQTSVPAYVQDTVNKELAQINAAKGILPSAVFPDLKLGEDYSQYAPRGHYTKSDALKAYFKSMMWYGRMTFRLSVADETKSALLLVKAVQTANVNGKPGPQAWNDLYAPTVFFIGRSDALTIPQYLQIMDQVYGTNTDIKTIQAKGVDPFVNAASALPAPRILNAVITVNDNVDQATKGLRFMGQRFVWDAYAFRELIYRNVGTDQNPRALPSSLDVFAALGSDRALQILDSEGQTKFEHYSDQMNKVRGEIGVLQEADWTETLYGGWLYTLTGLNQKPAAGSPSFMNNQAYQDRSLYAALGSFAELKHDTILYAEQAYAEAGGGGGKEPAPSPVLPPNYVEPVPLFWARLAALAEMTQSGLGSRKLLVQQDSDSLAKLAAMARRFQQDSALELKGQPLGDQEQQTLRFYGADLEKIYAATADPGSNGPSSQFSDQPQAAIVADVATDPQSQQALELGVGRVFDIFVAVPAGDRLNIAHGAVYSFYEFKQPISNRLTDQSWQQMLAQDKTPAVPDWTSSFMSKNTVDHALSEAVRQFQDRLTFTLWYNPEGDYANYTQQNDATSKFLVSQLAPLVQAHQYEGRQIIETNFRSFDMKDTNTAIVTTRETWRGELHNNGPDSDSNGPKVAERGPYTLDVTYTLTRGQDNSWQISNIVVKGQLPAWNKTS